MIHYNLARHVWSCLTHKQKMKDNNSLIFFLHNQSITIFVPIIARKPENYNQSQWSTWSNQYNTIQSGESCEEMIRIE